MAKKANNLGQTEESPYDVMGVLLADGRKETEFITEIQEFEYNEYKIRTFSIDGEIWFVANDICDSIDIKNPRDAIKLLDQEDVGSTDTLTAGGIQNVNIVNESGLYQLVFQSRKNEAKNFKRWVTREVLPSIRKTGKYELPDTSKLTENEKRILIREEIKKHNPKLSEAAQKSGVGITSNQFVNNQEFAIFHNKGYQGLYGGLGKKEIARKKGLNEKDNILDHMGSTELAANFFRVTQTEEKLKNENIKTKKNAYDAHYIVGQEVRKAMIAIGGVKPEDIPFQENIKKIEKIQKKNKSELISEKKQYEIEIDIATQLWSVALLIASTMPAGIVTTKILHTEIPKYITIPESYKEISETKQEPKINQVIRNIKSNKKNKTSIFSRGYAIDIPGGFQITKEGLDFVKEAFKGFL